MVPSLTEIIRALHGTQLLIRRHPDAHLMFDCTVGGFWRSLFAAVLILPGHAYMTWHAVQTQTYGYHALATDLLIYAIVWLAYPAAMALWMNALDRDDRLLDYLVPYNWIAVPIAYLIVAATMLSETGQLSANVDLALKICVYGFSIMVLLDLARRQLSVGFRLAFAIVGFDLVLTMAIVAILKSFAGR